MSSDEEKKTAGPGGSAGARSSYTPKPASEYSAWVNAFGIDFRSMALYRVFLGGTILYDLYHRTQDLGAHYTDDGVQPRYVTLFSYSSHYWFSFHMINGSLTFMQIMFFLHACVALSFILGYRTRTSSALLWILCLSLQVRNELVLHSGDVYQRMQLFWAMFLPLGEMWSFDAALRDEDEILERKQSLVRTSSGTYLADFCTFSYAAQIAIMYVFSCYHKSGVEWTETFDATFWALQLDFFRKPFGDFLLRLGKPALRVFTWAVWKWEKWGCVLFFIPHGSLSGPLRLLGVIGYMCLHIGLGLSLRLESFTFITTSAPVLMIPAFFWDSLVLPLVRRRWAGSTIDIRYEATNPWYTALAKVVGTMLVFSENARVSPLPNLQLEEPTLSTFRVPSEVFVVSDGRTTATGYAAFLLLLAHSPILWWTRWFFAAGPTSYLITKAYALLYWQGLVPGTTFVLPNKRRPKDTRAWRLRREINLFLYIAKNVTCVFFITFIFFWNVGNFDPEWAPPEELNFIAAVTHTGQMWSMFSPSPPKSQFYYVVPAELVDGSKVDLFAEAGLFRWHGAPLTWEPEDPSVVHYSFGNHRWFKYYEAFNWGQGYSDLESIRLNVGRYMCRNWNLRHIGVDTLWTFQWWIVHVVTHPDGSRSEQSREVLWEHQCFDKKPTLAELNAAARGWKDDLGYPIDPAKVNELPSLVPEFVYVEADDDNNNNGVDPGQAQAMQNQMQPQEPVAAVGGET